MTLCRFLFAMAAFLFTAAAIAAEPFKNQLTPTAGRQQEFTLHKKIPHEVRMQYLLFVPDSYDKTKRWPLILYMHGGSLRGHDISQMKRSGLAEKVETEPKFPFIVVSPQCHEGEIWTDVDALAAVLDNVARTHHVDPDRIYITGHSMGGRGALYAAYKMADRFAAVISLSPISPITAWAGRLATVPLWLFQGADDQFTPLKEVKELVDAIEAAGGHPQMTVLPGRDHYILDIYNRPDLYQWLARQRRKGGVATTPATSLP